MNKLSITNEMSALDTKDRNWYDSLTDEETVKYNKNIWIQQRWLSSLDPKEFSGSKKDFLEQQAYYVQFTNEVVNIHFNTLRHHPKLQFQLLQAVTLGNIKRHTWIAPRGKGKESKISRFIKENYPNLNDDEVELFISMHDKNDLRELLFDFGLSKKETTALLR